MFDRKALGAFKRSLAVGAQGLEAERQRELRRLAAVERAAVLREQRQRSGHTPTDLVVVDGKRGAPIAQAEQLVVIEYGYLREVVDGVLRGLVARSPHVSGTYARSFQLLVDGVEADSIAAIQHGTRSVVIVNTQPYARRLEIGRRKDGRPFVIQVKSRIVEEVALLAASRWGNVAKAQFGYFDLDAAYALRSSAGRRKDRRAGSPIRYPGIRITAL
jgi:hypothetical protein